METLSLILGWIGILSIIYWAVKRFKAKKNGQIYKKQYIPITVGLLFIVFGTMVDPIKSSKVTTNTDVKQSSDYVTKKTSISKSEKHAKKDSKTSSEKNHHKSSVSKSTSSDKITKSSSTSSVTATSTSKTTVINYNFDDVEPSMSMDQVISAIGKQPTDRDEYTLYYGKEDLDFNENKLIGSSVQSIQDKIDAKYKAEQKAKEKKKNQEANLKSQAQYFGQKDVETLQKMSSTYKSLRIDNGMMYTFNFNGDMLVRVDSDDGYTNVYKYDTNASNGLGENLYTGKTIMQKEKRSYYFLN
jgi:hypothetical protein